MTQPQCESMYCQANAVTDGLCATCFKSWQEQSERHKRLYPEKDAYMPTPQEIEATKEALRAKWKRGRIAPPPPVEIATVSTGYRPTTDSICKKRNYGG